MSSRFALLTATAAIAGCATERAVPATEPPVTALAAPAATPVNPPPATPVTPPPNVPPPPPVTATQASAVDGEWVYTAQYGWVWMPYSPAYTYVPSESASAPLMYVYAPVGGWKWVAAPWVWGLGPQPWFSVGPVRFAWYGHPWLGHPGYGYRGVPARHLFRVERRG